MFSNTNTRKAAAEPASERRDRGPRRREDLYRHSVPAATAADDQPEYEQEGKVTKKQQFLPHPKLGGERITLLLFDTRKVKFTIVQHTLLVCSGMHSSTTLGLRRFTTLSTRQPRRKPQRPKTTPIGRCDLPNVLRWGTGRALLTRPAVPQTSSQAGFHLDEE